jgi:hypothetical protein
MYVSLSYRKYKDEVKEKLGGLRAQFRIGNLAASPLKKWVYDVNAVDLPRFLHIF